MSDTTNRFTFKIDTVANTAGVDSLTASVVKNKVAQSDLGRQVRDTSAWVDSWHTSVQRAADGSARWGDQNRKTIAELQATRAAAAQAAQAQAAAAERQANLDIGARWKKQDSGAGRDGSGGSSRGGSGSGANAGGGMNASGLMAAAQFADDAQYGLRAVVNQIPMAVEALGGGAGLAGGIGLAAVAVNQLVNMLGRIPDAVDEKVLAAKMASVRAVFDATLEHLSSRLTESLDADLAKAEARVTERLTAWRQTMQNIGEKGTADAAAAANKGSAQDASNAWELAQSGGADDPATKTAMDALNQQQAHERAQAELAAKEQAAAQAVRTAEQGVKASQSERARAQQFLSGNTGLDSPAEAARREVAGRLATVGVKSDQQQQVERYDSAKQDYETRLPLALKAEQERDSYGPLDPRRLGASARANYQRGKMTESEQSMASLEPTIEASRAGLARGDVTFNSTDPKALSPAQSAALAEGSAELAAIESRIKAAKETIAKAAEAEAAATKALSAAKTDQEQVNLLRPKYNLERTAAQVQRGELPELPPEQVAADQNAVRGAAGVSGQPMLPGGFVPPDLGGAEQAFQQAMSQTAGAVQSSVGRMASGAERMANEMVTLRSTIEGRMASLESRLDAMRP